MIPLHDDNPRVMTPFVNYGLIALNVFVFFRQFTMPEVDLQAFVYTYGAIPAQITSGEGYFSLFTSMFLHGGIIHLLSNMLYLYIFGDNIEGLMGHGRYLLFYVLCGIGAAASHIFIEPQSQIPMIGASGAISGVLGAYLLKFPRAKVLILFWIIIFVNTIRVPAIVVLGLWFFMQLSSGLSSLGMQSGGGVAWFAHIGGFVVGLVLVNFFQKRPVIKTEW
jgi:membrane associated rhomboid family serine protease